MNRPPVLARYLSTNDILPPGGLPTLDVYLAQLNRDLEKLERDINQLQSLLDAKREEHGRLEREYRTCVSIKSPIRGFPHEILGLIFGFAVGTPPFNRYIDVVHLRGVCLSWRQVAMTTPGLWTSLTIDVDRWCPSDAQELSDDGLLRHFQQELLPWLALLSRTRPFHLTLTSRSFEDHERTSNNDLSCLRKLAWYMLSIEPGPSVLTLGSPLSLLSTIHFPEPCPTVTKVEIAEEASTTLDGFTISESQFPNLKALEINGFLPFRAPPFPHSSLETLNIGNATERGVHFQQLLQSLPSLRKLRVDRRDSDIDLSNHSIFPIATYSHPSIEVLVIDSEDMLFAFRHVSLPRLRLLVISGQGLTFDDNLLESDVLSNVFSRLTSEPLLVSLRGDFYQPLLSHLLDSLPPETHLHFDVSSILLINDPFNLYREGHYSWKLPIAIESDIIEEIFCDRGTVDLWWLLFTSPARNQSSRPLTIYLPTGYGGWEEGYDRRDELIECDFEVEPLPNKAIGMMVRKLAPTLSQYAAGWWEPEILGNSCE
ncbi:hypothetical protein BKA70DRAFT_1341835 [Coprinopsis sp. MPI-PUGE-AT-0042]|nr:hypothetical protein BKA70DRAFT_1341835 [Coprinopsis sp. MPI-PUGE-AT-0042]